MSGTPSSSLRSAATFSRSHLFASLPCSVRCSASAHLPPPRSFRDSRRYAGHLGHRDQDRSGQRRHVNVSESLNHTIAAHLTFDLAIDLGSEQYDEYRKPHQVRIISGRPSEPYTSL